MRSSAWALSLACLLALVLTGCTLNTTAAPTAEAGAAISGIVHGGQNPIIGAHVYLFAANAGVFTPNTNGYGNASVSLLTAGTGRTQDTTPSDPTYLDYYVTTDSNGNFSITGDYSCTAGQQVYLYAVGGDPGIGSGTNSAVGLMAVLGNCPGGTSAFATGTPFVFMNEVSTVAAAYAFAGYATDAVHVSSSGTPAAKLGIANAFVNAQVLQTSGVANAAIPPLTAGSGGGDAPQAEVNTLGNILAACVNSNGTGSACTTLFANAESGGTTGNPPADTATAAINIAHNPVAAVGTLYGLSMANAQFSPTLMGQPNDFTMSIYYDNSLFNDFGALAIDANDDVWFATDYVFKLNGQGYDLTGYNGYSGFNNPYNIAIDVNGNAWALNSSAVGKFSNSGTLLSPTNGYNGLGLSTPVSIAMDASSNAWIGNYGGGNVVKVSSTGTLSGTFTGSGLSAPGPVAIDSSGDAWIADESSGAIVKLSNAGVAQSGSTGYTAAVLSTPTGIAIDHSGNVWVSNSGGTNGSVVEISSTGGLVSSSTGYTNSALGNPGAIAIDGAGNAWVADPNTISEISPTGTFLSGSTGFTVSNGYNSIGIDGSGDVVLNYDVYNFQYTNPFYYMQVMVGAATPVVTPVSLAAKNNTLGTTP